MRAGILGKSGICLLLASLLLSGCSGNKRTETAESVSAAEQAEKRAEEIAEQASGKNDSPVMEEETEKTAVNAEPVPTEEADELESRLEEYLDRMTLEEKVAQMFFVLPESLTGTELVTAAGEITRQAYNEIPVGGLVYMARNLESPSQVQEMMRNVQTFSRERIGLPVFTGVDEEGGTVTRISGRGNFDVPVIGDMCDVGSSGDVGLAYETGTTIGIYLKELGFNVDFAPDADVLSNPDNQVVRYRSFGSDPNLVAEMAAAELKGLEEQGVLGCFKHFPGHGATEGDTHAGYAYTDKTLEELETCELIPFQRGISEGVSMIMVGHISAPSVTGDDTPASLSAAMITDILRNRMGYKGIVITDAMNMGAISQTYSSGEAAVQSILAGADMILMPQDFASAYGGVLEAVENQRISVERIDQSVERILRVKLQMA